MSDNVLDFEARKESHVFKRKQDKVDAIRKAFRQARGDAEPTPPKARNKRKKSRRK